MKGKSETTRPFELHEKRMLKLDKSKLDAKHLDKGKVPSIEAEHSRTDSHAWGKARHYILNNKSKKMPETRVQLNHGNLKNDERRLTGIMESILAPAPKITTKKGDEIKWQ